MSIADDRLYEAITTLVESLPEGAVAPLVEAIAVASAGAWATMHASTARILPTPHYRERVAAFLTAWQIHAPHIPPQSVALALQAAGHTLVRQRRAQSLELVWTGPSSGQPLRRTAQVLGGLIDASQRELLIVSFAVYDIPEIGQALLAAARRGVHIRLIIESPKESAGKLAYDSLAAFGPEVLAQAEVYHWPLDLRPKDESGRYGSLHAKCAVADHRQVLISSANLTHYALNLNMELGVCITGGLLPAQIHAQFERLILNGILRKASATA